MDFNDIVEHIFASRWISGTRMEDAIKSSTHFNALGIRAIINYLGEDITKQEMVDSTVDTYIRLIRYILLSLASCTASLFLMPLSMA